MDEKIAIIGNEDFFAGFRALGVIVRDPAQEGVESEEIFSSLDPAEYAVVFVAEQEAEKLWDMISERNRKTPQTVIAVPGGRERTGSAGMKIRELVRRAVGADVG